RKTYPCKGVRGEARAMSTFLRPDILIQRPVGNAVAIVEIHNSINFSREEATESRQTLLNHGYGLQPAYFLMLSQDQGFLWKGVDKTTTALKEFDMRNIVARYFPGLAPTDRIRGAELSLIVLWWLNILAGGRQSISEEPERTLEGTGFLRAI